MSTAAFGFTNILIAAEERNNRGTMHGAVSAALYAEAKSLKINPTKPSDALDQSRDLIVGDAVAAFGRQIESRVTPTWEIRGHSLLIAADGINLETIDWGTGL
jgi:hypothetical protein